jgi:hypothetical protein
LNAIVMTFVRSQALSGLDRASKFVPRLLVSTVVAAIWPAAATSAFADDPKTVQQGDSIENHEAEQKHEPEPGAPPAGPGNLCEALAAAAATHDLPVDFFTRLIWQESRFRPDALSRAGAQGVAQFMPGTARLRGLENPFDPLEAIAKSAELLGDLRREFGNLGLAAAAYNAGSGRVRDWLGGRRPLPGETRAYVRIVTGRTVEEWSGGRADSVEMGSLQAVPCNPGANNSAQLKPTAAAKTEPVKPWGVEVVGGSTPANALARYREWRVKYAAIVADREPHVVVRGFLGNMGAVRVRVGTDTQAEGAKLCAALRAAGTYCDVLRNSWVPR